MAEEPRDTREEEPRSGLGFQDLSMNEVPASKSAGEGEEPQRSSRVGLIAFGVLVAAALIVLGARLISNAAPGQEAEDRLRRKLASLPAWERGVVLEARYMAGNRLRLEFAPSLSVSSEEGRAVIREATKGVLEVLCGERPGRDLYIDGYQGDERIVSAEYRSKTTLIGPGGEQVADIAVRVKGDPEGGMGDAYGRARPGGAR